MMFRCSGGLLVRRIGRRADVRVAQVLQHGSFVVVHAAGKIRIVEPLIPRGLRHVLQHAKLLLHHLLTVPRHLLPLGPDIILDVLLLFRGQIPPGLFLLAEIGLLRFRKVIPLIELLANLGLFIGREILECAAVLQDAFTLRRTKVAHGINPGTRGADARLLALVQVRARLVVARTILIIESILRMTVALVRIRGSIRISRAICTGRRTVRIGAILILRMRLRLRRMSLRLRRPIVVGLLRPHHSGKRSKARQRQNDCAELGIFPHCLFCFAAAPTRPGAAAVLLLLLPTC